MDPILLVLIILLLLGGGGLHFGHIPAGGENIIGILIVVLIIVILVRAIQTYWPRS